MKENEQLNEEFNESIDMEQAADSAFDEIKPGVIVQGEVVTTDKEYVYVNVGSKYEGRVPKEDFDELPQVGQIFPVIARGSQTQDGMYQFSVKEAIAATAWQNFITKFGTQGSVVTGKIVKSIQNGKVVDCDGFEAFMPFSLSADLKGASTSDERQFTIKSIDKKKRSVIISRKDYLDEQHKVNWDRFIAAHKVGDIVEGEVVKFVEFGAFIRVDGVDALLHRNDMSWKNVFKQRRLLKLNEKHPFVILNINSEENKIALGLKQLTADPWLAIDEKFPTGTVLEGKVVTVVNTGAFVEFDGDIEGFLPNAELSWAGNVSAKNMFQKKDKISVAVIDVNREERRLILSYRRTLPNPWDTIADKFPVGSVHKSKIKNVAKFGLFVELSDGIDGLIHLSDISWDDKDDRQLKTYSAGDEVEFKILDIKQDAMRVACGIKQLQKSPWEKISEKYKSGMTVSGTVSGITEFGIFLKLEDKVEGLVHASEIPKSQAAALEDSFKIGEQINAVVLGVDVKRKRFSLSIKKYEDAAEKEEVKKILNETSPNTATIGDLAKLKQE